MERPALLDLHPVEALIVILWLSVATLALLLTSPPQPWRPRQKPAPLWTVTHVSIAFEQPQASAAPPVGRGPAPTVAELRTMARQRGITTAGGRPIHKARHADLLSTLGLS